MGNSTTSHCPIAAPRGRPDDPRHRGCRSRTARAVTVSGDGPVAGPFKNWTGRRGRVAQPDDHLDDRRLLIELIVVDDELAFCPELAIRGSLSIRLTSKPYPSR